MLARALVVAALVLAACSDSESGGAGGSGGASGSGGAGGTGGSTALAPAEWAREAIVYHLYVRSYADSDGDGQGDYAGLIAKLDHVQGLGATAILLLPVVDADQDIHGGYTTTDFMASETDYGDLAAFDALVSEVHGRGLKLLVDMPFDLAADTHPFFVSARSSVSSPHHDWFPWVDAPCPDVTAYFPGTAWREVPEIGRCYWAKWGPTVVEWNYANPDVRAHILSAAKFWQDRGVDGFRLDSAPVLDDDATSGALRRGSEGTHAFWRELMSAAKERDPEFFTVAEVFDGDPASVLPYYDDGIDMTFDYPVYLSGLLSSLDTGQAEPLAASIDTKLALLPGRHMGGLFLGNHDVPGQEQGRFSDVYRTPPERLVQAAALLFSLPGTPFVYYGEEIGLCASNASAQRIRNPMQWDGSAGRGFTTGTPWAPFCDDASLNVAAQAGASGSLLETYKGLIAVRKSSPALSDGSYRRIGAADPHVYAFLREAAGERVLAIFNFDGAPHAAALDLKSAGITQAKVSDRVFAYPEADVTPEVAAAWGPEIAAHGARWLRVE